MPGSNGLKGIKPYDFTLDIVMYSTCNHLKQNVLFI